MPITDRSFICPPPAQTPPIRPDVQAFLDMMAAHPRPPMNDHLVAMIRRIPPGTMASPDLPVSGIAVMRDMVMEGPGGRLSLRLYDPRDNREASPVVMFCHGGGFVVGNEDTHGGLAAAIACGLDMPVVSVDYRLAPEHAWPAAPDDTEAAARWIASDEGAAALGHAVAGLILVGDSAGGNLAIVTAMALRDHPAARPVMLLWPIYPVTDLPGEERGDYESGRCFQDGYGLASADSAYFRAAYAAPAGEWRASPLVGEMAGLPPILLATAGLDPLRDQGRAFAGKAIAAGVDLTYVEYAGTIHGFATYRAGIPSAQRDLADMIALAKGLLARG